MPSPTQDTRITMLAALRAADRYWDSVSRTQREIARVRVQQAIEAAEAEVLDVAEPAECDWCGTPLDEDQKRFCGKGCARAAESDRA